MWSVWSERIYLYLGQSLAVLKTKRQGERVVQFTPNLPMPEVLAQLTQEVVQMGIAKKRVRSRLHITLSGAMCTASAFGVPQGVKRWDELHSIACASTASATGAHADQLVCETVDSHPGLSGSIYRALFDQLHQWAAQQHCQVVSLQPLWATASHCPAARSAAIKGIWLQEPDATTVVAQGQDGKWLASTLHHNPGNSSHGMQLRRWLVGLDFHQTSVLKLGFDADMHARLQQGPTTWEGHWTLAPETP